MSEYFQLRAFESGCGLEENPLQMVWASGEPKLMGSVASPISAKDPQDEESFRRDQDYESITLMRLRQAQERKRLNEELDDND